MAVDDQELENYQNLGDEPGGDMNEDAPSKAKPGPKRREYNPREEWCHVYHKGTKHILQDGVIFDAVVPHKRLAKG